MSASRCSVTHNYFWPSLRILVKAFLERKTQLWILMWTFSGCCVGSSGSPHRPSLSRVRKTSHNALKTLFQGVFHLAISHCTQWKQITTILSAYYDVNILRAYFSALNLLLETQVNNHHFALLFVICHIIAISQRFNLFCPVRTKTYLNHWNSETKW